MSETVLTKTRIRNGVWEGVLRADGREEPPGLRCVHDLQDVDGVEVSPAGEGQWVVRVPIPPEALNEGIQGFLIEDASSGEVLGKFAVLAGDTVEADVRAELALLRAELDLLKRAFRRHCAETE